MHKLSQILKVNTSHDSNQRMNWFNQVSEAHSVISSFAEQRKSSTKKNVINTSNTQEILTERFNGSLLNANLDLKRADTGELRSKRIMIEQPLELREQKVYNELIAHLECINHPISYFILEFHRVFSNTYTSYIEQNKEEIERASRSFKINLDPRASTTDDNKKVISEIMHKYTYSMDLWSSFKMSQKW